MRVARRLLDATLPVAHRSVVICNVERNAAITRGMRCIFCCALHATLRVARNVCVACNAACCNATLSCNAACCNVLRAATAHVPAAEQRLRRRRARDRLDPFFEPRPAYSEYHGAMRHSRRTPSTHATGWIPLAEHAHRAPMQQVSHLAWHPT